MVRAVGSILKLISKSNVSKCVILSLPCSHMEMEFTVHKVFTVGGEVRRGVQSVSSP